MWLSEGYVNNALKDTNYKGTERFFINEVQKVIGCAKKPVVQGVKGSGSSVANVGKL